MLTFSLIAHTQYVRKNYFHNIFSLKKGEFMFYLKSRKVAYVKGRQIFDSRGTPTVEACVTLEDGTTGAASVPSGASTGKYEAHELRDNDRDFGGKSVYAAVNAIETVLNDAVSGTECSDQYLIDSKMIEADGTENKMRLGANSILAVSLACAKAASRSYDMPLFRYLGGTLADTLPVPLMNILNGGAHASNNLDIQEFMIVPVGAKNFHEAMKMGCETYAQLKKILSKNSLSVSVGDEGGFAPSLSTDEEALSYITDAIEAAGYVPGEEISLALDVAASEWYDGGEYHLPKRNKIMTSVELSEYYSSIIGKYPIISIEDPFSEEDWDSFCDFTSHHPSLQIVGDDLFVTNIKRIRKGVEISAANAVLIKPNQIGSLSETLEAISYASRNGYNTIISHRSAETCDTSIADIAVASNSGQIKTGAPCRGERIAKYNRLLRISDALGQKAVYGFSR